MLVNKTISSKPLTIEDMKMIVEQDCSISLADETKDKITACRAYLDNKIKNNIGPIYGINTGFGSLYSKNISSNDLEKLQDNLVKSHACGTGPEIPQEIVRLMIFLKVQSLGHGHSGVQLVTVQRLIDFFNNKAYPVVFEMGSLGASGDLVPLAHLSLPLIGLGNMRYNNELISSREALKNFDWQPIQLKSKEGLALLNGTQFMGAFSVWCMIQAHRLIKLADYVGALSLEAFGGNLHPFNERVHKIRPQLGQGEVANHFLSLLEGSQLMKQSKKHIQDPYSFRCIPQVHGASRDAVGYFTSVVLAEANSVTDNPLIFVEEDEIISAGNFHGQPLALAFDFLCIALSELGSISERRTFQIISGNRDLPLYLVSNSGINSGLMIPQYTAASLVSQNKQLCTPASVDSIVSSNGQEDHVSMGANAALKAYRVVNNVFSILAIELISASQALHFREPAKTSPILEKFIEHFRQVVPFVNEDRVFHNDIAQAETFCKKFN